MSENKPPQDGTPFDPLDRKKIDISGKLIALQNEAIAAFRSQVESLTREKQDLKTAWERAIECCNREYEARIAAEKEHCKHQGEHNARRAMDAEFMAIDLRTRLIDAEKRRDALREALEEIREEEIARMRGDGIPESKIGTPDGFTSRVLSITDRFAALSSSQAEP